MGLIQPKDRKFKYIYGPVSSWRLGRSLGVDLISGEKICSFDCIYCQIGKTVKHSLERKVFIPTTEIIKELSEIPDEGIDYITFSGTGEPTLALNLGEIAMEIKKRFKYPLAILTNSTLITDPQVRKELSFVDLVVAKIDAPNEESFRKINVPVKGITLEKTIKGIKSFNKEYPNKLALQMMFLSQNKGLEKEMADLAKEINPKEVQINTPLRPSEVGYLSRKEIKLIEKLFKPLKAYSVYDVKPPEAKPIDHKAMLKRRPTV